MGYDVAAITLPQSEKFRLYQNAIAPGVSSFLIVPQNGMPALEVSPWEKRDTGEVMQASFVDSTINSTLEQLERVLAAACNMPAQPSEVEARSSIAGVTGISVKWNVS
ncbi:hypothetical protein FIU97_14540 [Roseivivax sp. THAF40]|uniref:hypothetical protein n=1 Tax=Roseivivax sp. THAF40 TaxID=2587858 RepID=UPI0012683187|nr:hypothetical protein [Roseivivax sp. THAF40]QFT47797.1 hypothetical protein FIU97_14540 [Roseivivax sp. THAF40]